MTTTTTTTQAPTLDIVSLKDISEKWDVPLHTVRAWSYRGVLPTPQATVSGRIPVWETSTIAAWFDAREAARAEAQEAASAPEAEVVSDTESFEDEYPLPRGAGWFELSDGTKVQGQEKATKAQRKLNRRK